MDRTGTMGSEVPCTAELNPTAPAGSRKVFHSRVFQKSLTPAFRSSQNSLNNSVTIYNGERSACGFNHCKEEGVVADGAQYGRALKAEPVKIPSSVQWSKL